MRPFLSAALTAVLVLAFSALPRAGAASSSPGGKHLFALSSSLMPGLGAITRLRPLAAQQQLGIGVSLRVRQSGALDRLAAAVADPASPQFHHYLSVAQYRARFAPTAAQRASVTAWLRSGGLTVTGTAANGMLIEARGSVQKVTRTLHTGFSTYRTGKQTWFANTSAVQVPPAVAGVVQGVLGLTNRYTLRHPSLKLRPRTGGTKRAMASDTNNGYTPQDIRQLYDFNTLYTRGIDGSGETIGIVGEPVDVTDIQHFDTEYNLPDVNLQQETVSDPKNTGSSKPDPEYYMDAEVSHAIAPGAGIIMYADINQGLDSIVYTLVQMVSENKVQVITSSVGAPEDHWTSYPSDIVTPMHDVLREAAVQGQTFFAASGDNGAFDAATDGKSALTRLAVDYPCSDLFTTCVGGTTLTQNEDGTYGGEISWSDNSDPNNPGGSGGGLSGIFFQQPWQNAPGTTNTYNKDQSRMVPDVSANGDPNTGYALYVQNERGVNHDDIIAGTSAAAPLWAGLTALLNQSLGQKIGFFNPTLYTLGSQTGSLPAAPFHDITQGTNLYYPATPGFDLATGLGSPDASNLDTDLHHLGALTRTPIITLGTPVITQKVSGKAKKVSTVKKSVSANYCVPFAVTYQGSTTTTGQLQITKGKAKVGAWNLKLSTSGGTSLYCHSTKIKTAGGYTAAFLVGAGDYGSEIDRNFKVK